MAYSALLERTVNKSRQEVYDAIADFGAIGEIVPQICKSVELAGSGVGSTRTIELNPDSGIQGVVVERVEVADPGRTFTYSILGNPPLPVTDYVATVHLDDAPGGKCAVRYGSNWVPEGDVAEIKAMFEGLYGQILDGIEAR